MIEKFHPDDLRRPTQEDCPMLLSLRGAWLYSSHVILWWWWTTPQQPQEPRR